MQKEDVRVYFTDFWERFNVEDNFITKILSLRYNIIIDPVDPQLLVFSINGFDFLKYKKAVRLFFTGESYTPNFNFCDFALSFDYDSYGGRNLRYPLYVLYDKADDLLKPKLPDTIMSEKTKFCNMLVSQSKCKYRIEFFKTLNNIRRVDSGGKVMNNMGGLVPDKMAFIQQYRFTIAMENRSTEGYTTEKIFDPMRVNSIPIYWGNPRIAEEFNAKSFVNIADFGSLKEAAQYVVSVDDDPEKYKALLQQPWCINNELNDYFSKDRVLNFLSDVVLAKYPFSDADSRQRAATARLTALKKRAYLFITRRSF